MYIDDAFRDAEGRNFALTAPFDKSHIIQYIKISKYMKMNLFLVLWYFCV